ncbi:hypothetical protein DPMN_117505 [Dreissena polymorpha]|uniref:Uncharacterized protein n=1 Tax=Dreissena polymorpha TaxID=45954 RepID=A0A9D4H8J1_DREPO|nr:hypothetical protein DPMN_103699 [Dreissena polymorpha]KAH3843970.1 hypothetical protein DPMN_117505 [Dreissena polymorpha]
MQGPKFNHQENLIGPDQANKSEIPSATSDFPIKSFATSEEDIKQIINRKSSGHDSISTEVMKADVKTNKHHSRSIA